jgi:hypothetical protein
VEVLDEAVAKIGDVELALEDMAVDMFLAQPSQNAQIPEVLTRDHCTTDPRMNHDWIAC